MLGDGWMSRREAAIYLTKIGFPCDAQYLANLAYKRKGPPFVRRGWRSVFYHRDKLKAWASLKIEEVHG